MITNKLELDYSVVSKLLIEFIKEEVSKTGVSSVVVGLSGGIDSAVAAYLAKEALGKNNVHAILMPYKLSSKNSIEDAMLVVQETGIQYNVVDITPMSDAYISRFKNIDKVRAGNVFARMRMIVLFDHSHMYKSLVLGTSNKTELLLGYGTWYGDMASSLNPLGDLYKCQVRGVASHIGVPERIVKKKPTADLWVGQTDEDELGFSYDEADVILYHLYDLRWNPEEVSKRLGFDIKLVELIEKKVAKNQFKRLPPIIAKVSERTVNVDFRYLRDWGL